LQLAIGYNGLGRLDGNETGSVGGGGGQGPAFGGATGLLRLLHSEFGGQVSWLLPAALIALAAMLWVSRRAMAIGGFNGSDPWPTLAVFEQLVASHEVHYYVGPSSESFGGGRGSSAIASWVAAHFKKETVGGETVYDLTQPLSGTA
jgi:hypothetical protein